MSTTSTVWALQAPQISDAANIETAVKPLRDRLEILLTQINAGGVPIGGGFLWSGGTDPAADPSGVVRFLLADGRLIDRTIHSTFFTAFGHTFNGGVDPGSNTVRIPDLRGRTPVGADNMGTAAGAASRLPNSNRVLGQSGGEERHTLTEAELAPHNHGTGLAAGSFLVLGGPSPNIAGSAPGSGSQYSIVGATQFTGIGTPHNVLQPYQVVNYVIRVR